MYLNEEGYLGLSRNFQKFRFYNNPNIVHFYLYLMLKANFKETRKKGLRLKRGQVLYDLYFFHKELNQESDNIVEFLSKLANCSEIDITKNDKDRVITIRNYDEYTTWGRNGGIKLHRKILNWEHWKLPKVCHLFVHLILSANYRNSTVDNQQLSAGDILIGRISLSKHTGLSEMSVRSGLKKLMKTGEIALKCAKRGKYSIFTIINYSSYQEYTIEIKISQPENHIFDQTLIHMAAFYFGAPHYVDICSFEKVLELFPLFSIIARKIGSYLRKKYNLDDSEDYNFAILSCFLTLLAKEKPQFFLKKTEIFIEAELEKEPDLDFKKTFPPEFDAVFPERMRLCPLEKYL